MNYPATTFTKLELNKKSSSADYFKELTDEHINEIQRYLDNGYHIIIAGRVEIGKTTFLKLLLDKLLSQNKRIFIIDEDQDFTEYSTKCALYVKIRLQEAFKDLSKFCSESHPAVIVISKINRRFEDTQALFATKMQWMTTMFANSFIDVLNKLEMNLGDFTKDKSNFEKKPIGLIFLDKNLCKNPISKEYYWSPVEVSHLLEINISDPRAFQVIAERRQEALNEKKD